MSHIAQFVRGFAMGTADIVPGVSGGTVALVAGIYERLVANIHAGAHVLRAVLRRSGIAEAWKAVEWGWLVTLLAGVLTAILTLSSVLTRLLEEFPVETAAVFFGLVVGAVVSSWRTIRVRTPMSIVAAAVAAVGLFVLLGLRTDTESVTDDMVSSPLWVFFGAGAIAVCAMILPGISGSLILVMMGMYSEILAAVDQRNVGAVLATGLGCVLGLAAFSTVLNWMLEHHHDLVLATMVGLMIGSLRVLWPWPGGTATTTLAAPGDGLVIALVLMVAGAALVVFLSARAAKRHA